MLLDTRYIQYEKHPIAMNSTYRLKQLNESNSNDVDYNWLYFLEVSIPQGSCVSPL